MRARGPTYWCWANSALHSRCHAEAYADGVSIDVEVRLSPKGVTQLFVGVYASGGIPLLEEVYDTRSEETMTQALAWGVVRARTTAALRSPLVCRVWDQR
nr:hypothetical protein [Pseudomonas putida]